MTEPLQPFVFGKLPLHGDFLRVVRPGAEGDAVDQWIAGGIERMHTDYGEDFSEVFGELVPMRFLYCDPTSRSGVVGILHPSRDAAGRQYPVVMGFTLPAGFDAGPDQWPLLLEQQLDELAALVGEDGPEDLEGLQTRLQELARPANPTEGALHWQSGLAGRRSAALWHGVSGSGGGGAVLEGFRTVLEDAYPPRFLVRLPAGGAADACLWLSLLAMWSPAGTGPVFAGWPAQQGDAVATGLRLVLDGLRPRYLSPALLPGRSSPVAYDAAEAAKQGTLGQDARGAVPGGGGSLLDLLREVRR